MLPDAHDPTDTPSAIALKTGSSTLQSFTYTDAPAGNITAETDTPSSASSPADYTYDAQSRVTSMTPGTGSALNYGFDPSGNLTTLPTGATGTYDHGGELTSSALAGTTTSYAYNADGERLTATQGTTTIASGTWNGAGQLTAYDSSTADMTAATYDGTGLRSSAATSSASQAFTWNTTTQVPEVLQDSTNAYIYAGSGAPAEQVNLSTGTISYLVTDLLGSVRGIASSTGALTATTSYDAWGNPENEGGLVSSTPFGFAGGYTDPTGLVYFIDRYYDPQTGQFASVDPLASQTLEPYLYAGDNPVNETDPSGALHTKWHCGQRWLGACIWWDGIDFYFTYKFTYALATAGVIVFVPVIALIHRLIDKFFGPLYPLDDWIKDKFNDSLTDAYDEAVRIVGNDPEDYLIRKNKSCLMMSVQMTASPHVYSESYKHPKAWCIG